MWKSKLGHEYKKSYIEQNERTFKAELNKLRKLPENRLCADCASEGTVWASVNLGVFLCLRCGALHRGLGTHISVPKGCTGTYLWGPDELEQMRLKGNAKARDLYGGDNNRPSAEASDEVWREFIRDKYELLKFSPRQSEAATISQAADAKIAEQDLISFDNSDTDLDLLDLGSMPAVTTAPDFFSEFGL
eukprot:CAMPEP_0185017434 /NCGR_PEP_ID=MMETSP1103-20130426/392_1 /TAXON_ID=36769 /ORGANISM="Paraphysomonas bandaiensis, Strain Caron Lab Isolate" /LENGTH=189 /DNA_ID=CAMNT_0027546851 /DNA_START=51 /DNA_END=620 /DNA_ORIENTATION=+